MSAFSLSGGARAPLARFRSFGWRWEARQYRRRLRRLGLRVAIIHDGPVYVVAWGRR